MGRSFVINIACLAGCWEVPQLSIDVKRDATYQPNLFVCDADQTACSNTPIFAIDDTTSTARPVSIFTKKSALFLEMTATQGLTPICIQIAIGSEELDRKLDVSSSGLVWSCPTTGNCELPVTCPASLP